MRVLTLAVCREDVPETGFANRSATLCRQHFLVCMLETASLFCEIGLLECYLNCPEPLLLDLMQCKTCDPTPLQGIGMSIDSTVYSGFLYSFILGPGGMA